MQEDDFTEATADQAAADAPRIERGLRLLGSEYDPPLGWEARVLSSTSPPRRVRLDRLGDYARGAMLGLVIAAVIAAIIAWLAGWL